MKAYWRVEVHLHAFFDLSTRCVCLHSFSIENSVVSCTTGITNIRVTAVFHLHSKGKVN
jgi:hypothetical protein